MPDFGLAREPMCTLEVEVARPVLSYAGAGGIEKRMIAITGGRVSGGLAGRVLPGGADFQTVYPDGRADIMARYCLEVAEGIVEVESRGLRVGPPEVIARLGRGERVEPGAYYFRTAVRLTSSAPALDRLTRRLYVAIATREPDLVRIALHEVL